MSDTIYIVRDPSGTPYACSVDSQRAASLEAYLKSIWSRHQRATKYNADTSLELINGYTCETITLPSLHDPIPNTETPHE